MDRNWGIWGGAIILPGALSPLVPLLGVIGLSAKEFPTVSRFLMIPSALSYCLPIALILGTLALFRDRRILALIISTVESIDAIKARRIKRSSWGLLSFIGAIKTAWEP